MRTGVKKLTPAQKEAYADSYKGKIHEFKEHIDYLYTKRDNNPYAIDALIDYWKDRIDILNIQMRHDLSKIEVDYSISKFYL